MEGLFHSDPGMSCRFLNEESTPTMAGRPVNETGLHKLFSWP